MTPSASAPPIVWAVFLGCTTTQRLAAEWEIPTDLARLWLRRAVREGLIERNRRGRYQARDLGPPRHAGTVARVRAMLRDPCQRFDRLDREQRRAEAMA